MDRPLAYDSLKAVLQFMEPNLRFIISRRIPSIGCAERAAPLKIKNLRIGSYEFVVDEHNYKLGVYRDYPPDIEVPTLHQEENSQGGVQNDLDQYGFDDYSSNQIVTPGDLVIESIEGKVADGDFEVIEGQLRHLQQILARRQEQGNRSMVMNDPNVLMNIDFYEIAPIEHLEKIIHLSRTGLKPYICCRDNTSTEFSKVIQFTATYPNGEQHISRRSGDMKLHQAQKKLASVLLGNRQAPIIVKHLSIDCQDHCKILRLPQNFRIKVREIEIEDHASAICDALQPIIDESSCPLNLIQITMNGVDELSHPLIKSAEKLIIDSLLVEEEWITEFQALENPRVHLTENVFERDDYVTLVRAWIDNRRAIGTCYTIGFHDELDVTSVFSRIKEACNGLDSGEGVTRIPLSDSAEIHVSYVPTPNENQYAAQWIMTIEIVAV